MVRLGPMTPSPGATHYSPLTLLILAAGRSSRFGTPKQFARVGPTGETLLDYALFDAVQAGFRRAVIVISPELGSRFENEVVVPWQARLPVELVEQRIAALPPGFSAPPRRTKPWGTVHAILAARASIPGPFGVINADDFYGAGAYLALAEWLGSAPPDEWVLVSYPLAITLPPTGAVNRAHCIVDQAGWLTGIEELFGVERDGEHARVPQPGGSSRQLGGDEAVSMNCWGFGSPVFRGFDEYFVDFLKTNGSSLDAESPLPEAVQHLIGAGKGRVKVLPRGNRWVGLTHPGDLPRVQEYFRELTSRGEYPSIRGDVRTRT